MSPQLLTRQKAREHVAREERGYLFPLPHTGGVYSAEEAAAAGDPQLVGTAKVHARVRNLSLSHLARMGNLSPRMQALVTEVFRRFEDSGDTTIRSWEDVVRTYQQADELTNGYCIAGFLAPLLVETQQEADLANDPNVVWVEEIDPRDRAAYRQLVQSGEESAARALEPFPETGLPGAAIGHVMPFTPAPESGAQAAALGLRPVGVP